MRKNITKKINVRRKGQFNIKTYMELHCEIDSEFENHLDKLLYWQLRNQVNMQLLYQLQNRLKTQMKHGKSQ
jgi:hypothetical protein